MSEMDDFVMLRVIWNQLREARIGSLEIFVNKQS